MRILLLTLALLVPVSLLHAEEALYLDVSIEVFETASLEQGHDALHPEVRAAEQRYYPTMLSLGMTESDLWGAVRVLPVADPGAELQISGKVLESDGAHLALQVRAVDAGGRVWFDRVFSGDARELVSVRQQRVDEFQHLIDSVEQRLADTLSSLDDVEKQDIKRIASLRYAKGLMPDVYGQYLSRDEEGLWHYARLPAENDALYQRVETMREHEYLFIDTVHQHYAEYLLEVAPVYDMWRRYKREQVDTANRYESNQEGDLKDFRRGSYWALRESYNNYRWSQQQEQYLDELSEGFANEMRGTDLNLEDSVYRLSGTLDQQYYEWREILKELYNLENS